MNGFGDRLAVFTILFLGAWLLLKQTNGLERIDILVSVVYKML